MALIYLPQKDIDAIKEVVSYAAYSSEEMKMTPDLDEMHEIWNNAVRTVSEVLDMALIAKKEEPVC